MATHYFQLSKNNHERIRDGGKLCQLYATPRGTLTITRELGVRGFAFRIQEPMPAEEAEGFMRELARC